jgi:hypothetical protein
VVLIRAIAIACVACASPAPQTTGVTPTGPTTTFSPSTNWGEVGCTPKGPTLTLSATVVVRPFGKGLDGAVLHTAGGDWIVSYRAEGKLLALRDKRVTATGRACDKEGQAIVGKHFDLATITEP